MSDKLNKTIDHLLIGNVIMGTTSENLCDAMDMEYLSVSRYATKGELNSPVYNKNKVVYDDLKVTHLKISPGINYVFNHPKSKIYSPARQNRRDRK